MGYALLMQEYFPAATHNLYPLIALSLEANVKIYLGVEKRLENPQRSGILQFLISSTNGTQDRLLPTVPIRIIASTGKPTPYW